MTTAATLPTDEFAAPVDTDTQRLAARMAQDIFAGIFREVVAPDSPAAADEAAALEARCRNWCQAGGSDEGQAQRLALLIAGLDQWGLAYSQAFRLTAIPALSALLGGLRNRLDARADTLFQQQFGRLESDEGAAIDFKVELRRSIHLALWHAMAACDTAEAAQAILQTLGSLMLALDRQMPELGWRLIADALANIQVCLLTEETAPLAQESTQQLFAALSQALPAERYRMILATSGQAVLAWQQARRAGAH